MKNKHLIVAFFVFFLSAHSFAADVYVNQSHTNASDDNAGTDSAHPWATLNPSKWTDNMTVHISAGTYTITTKIAIPATNVSLIGESRTGVVLQAMDDANFNTGTTSNTLFQVSGKTASFTTMTIKNVRDNTEKLGGAFDVLQSGSLTLTDITFTNLITAQSTWSGGGAIIVRGGTLTVDNCLFDACQSNIGGAIMSFTNSSITDNNINISNTKFINNSNTRDVFFPNSHFGGAITFSGKGTFNLDKCYFEGNSSRLNTSNSGSGTGGSIMVRLDGGATSTLNITNSVFYKNESDGAGSVLCLGSNGVSSSTVFNLNLTGNVVFQNKGNVYSGAEPNTIALYSSGVSYTGTFIIANNTFLQNNNTARANSKSITIGAMPVAAYFINNLMNDNEGASNIYGLTADAVANSATLRRFKGNIFNHLGGALSVSDNTNYPDLYESNSNSTNGNRSWVSNTYQKVNTELTTPSVGVPYLKTLSGAIGINFGVSTFDVNGNNVVPANDIRGKSIVGSSKDAGAFEYDPADDIGTAVNDLINETGKNFYYNSSQKTVVFEKKFENVQLFQPNGNRLYNLSNIGILNVSNLPDGVYIVRTLEKGVFKSQKFIKN
ncbi:MAG: hypothetical protein QM751_12500 [Paludibacteraceae bacterium]